MSVLQQSEGTDHFLIMFILTFIPELTKMSLSLSTGGFSLIISCVLGNIYFFVTFHLVRSVERKCFPVT